MIGIGRPISHNKMPFMIILRFCFHGETESGEIRFRSPLPTVMLNLFQHDGRKGYRQQAFFS